jgi:hypothetical protein
MQTQKTYRTPLNKASRFIYLVLLIHYLFIVDIAKSQVITVKQDGTGNYTEIQDAIDGAGYGDTVLVYPGTYYENLDFNGQSLTLASLNLTTGDPVYIHSTIIDGNHAGGCITLITGEHKVIIHGFTIQNGWKRSQPDGFFETYGGGILMYTIDTLKVFNSIIKNNEVNGGGGGICCVYGYLFLSGTTISGNYGSGLMVGLNGFAEFDSIYRCNIYLNYNEIGCDVHNSTATNTIHVVVDTMTVLNPDSYFLSSIDMYGFQNGLITYDILHEKIAPVDGDLFVNPIGSDTNSGLTLEEPLRSLSFALTKIVSDSIQTNTIHLATGKYSPSLTDEKYPLNIRNHITIDGVSKDSTFLDGDSVVEILRGNNEISHFAFKNLTISNGNGNANSNYGIAIMDLYTVNNCFFENVGFTGGVADFRSIFNVRGDKVKFDHCDFYRNYGGKPRCSIGQRFYPQGTYVYDTNEFIHCRFYDNQPSFIPGYGAGDGMVVAGNLEYDNASNVNIIDCEFTENVENFTGLCAVTCLQVTYNSVVNLINSTLGNNVCQVSLEGGAISISDDATLNVYNSILYGNNHNQFCLSTDLGGPGTLNIYNSLIQDGQEGIYYIDAIPYIYYDASNLNTNPLWDTASMFPYSLSEFSPCIDAGTLDLPPGIEFPEYDLAGNPRVWGESVDMGAYEYGPWVGVPTEPNSRFQIPDSRLLNISPNPFTYGTYVSYELKSSGRLDISVYSLSGMKVRTLENHNASKGDSGKFYWDGTDQQGNPLPAGVYLVRMTVDGKEVETLKAVRK